MIATISMLLVKATRNGNRVLTETVTFRKDEINKGIAKVNQFIATRVQDPTRIKVEKFTVVIKKNADSLNEIQRWEYRPTYR